MQTFKRKSEWIMGKTKIIWVYIITPLWNEVISIMQEYYTSSNAISV